MIVLSIVTMNKGFLQTLVFENHDPLNTQLLSSTDARGLLIR
jgi:hypothetical protein